MLKKNSVIVGGASLRVTIFGILVLIAGLLFSWQSNQKVHSTVVFHKKCQKAFAIMEKNPEEALLLLRGCKDDSPNVALAKVELALLAKTNNWNEYGEVFVNYQSELLLDSSFAQYFNPIYTLEVLRPLRESVWILLNKKEVVEAWKWKAKQKIATEDPETANVFLLEMLDIWPKDSWVHSKLVENYILQENHEKAMQHLNFLQKEDRSSEHLQNVESYIKKEWKEQKTLDQLESEHFRLSFQGEGYLEDGERLLELLESQFHDIASLWNYTPLSQIKVVLFRDLEFGGAAAKLPYVEASFDGKIRIPHKALIVEEKLRALSKHEMVHALLESWVGSSLPFWMNEGLAQFMEERELIAKPNFLGEVGDLYKPFLQKKDPQEVRGLYRASLFLVQELKNDFGEDSWVSYLKRLAEGEKDAFYDSFGVEEQSWIGKKLF